MKAKLVNTWEKTRGTARDLKLKQTTRHLLDALRTVAAEQETSEIPQQNTGGSPISVLSGETGVGAYFSFRNSAGYIVQALVQIEAPYYAKGRTLTIDTGASLDEPSTMERYQFPPAEGEQAQILSGDAQTALNVLRGSLKSALHTHLHHPAHQMTYEDVAGSI